MLIYGLAYNSKKEGALISIRIVFLNYLLESIINLSIIINYSII